MMWKSTSQIWRYQYKKVGDYMSSLFDGSPIKRIEKGGYVGKEYYDIILWNFSVIRVTDKREIEKLEAIIKSVKRDCERMDLEDMYYKILTDTLMEEGW